MSQQAACSGSPVVECAGRAAKWKFREKLLASAWAGGNSSKASEFHFKNDEDAPTDFHWDLVAREMMSYETAQIWLLTAASDLWPHESPAWGQCVGAGAHWCNSAWWVVVKMTPVSLLWVKRERNWDTKSWRERCTDILRKQLLE